MLSYSMAEEPDYEGWSNLHYAINGKFTNLLKSLLENSEAEKINMKDVQGRTPLHLACCVQTDLPLFLNLDSEVVACRVMNETERIIDLLLSHGAKCQIFDNNGQTPLHCLVDSWSKKQYPLKEIRKIISLFLHFKGDINCQDDQGRTVLHYVAGSLDIKVNAQNEIGPSLNRKLWVEPRVSNNIDNTKIFTKEELYWKEFLSILLEMGANINAKDNNGNTPLHCAIEASKFSVVNELLKENCDVNVKNNKGRTPLYLAVSDHQKFKQCAISLIHKGALVCTYDMKGRTPLDHAWRHPSKDGDREDFKCLLKHVILLMKANIHPGMDINMPRDAWKPVKKYRKKCIKECKNLNSYFELQGTSQLHVVLQSHRYPIYTKNDFFLEKIGNEDFNNLFPIYGQFLKYKFSSDENRKKVIDKCVDVFSHFGGTLYYSPRSNRVIYEKLPNLPLEVKLKIISYIHTSDLEYLEKHL